jgi:hypothetical protein
MALKEGYEGKWLFAFIAGGAFSKPYSLDSEIKATNIEFMRKPSFGDKLYSWPVASSIPIQVHSNMIKILAYSESDREKWRIAP